MIWGRGEERFVAVSTGKCVASRGEMEKFRPCSARKMESCETEPAQSAWQVMAKAKGSQLQQEAKVVARGTEQAVRIANARVLCSEVTLSEQRAP